MELNKIYLAIPYSRIDKNEAYKIANEITVHFLALGNNVFSPITHSHPLTKYNVPGDWSFWSRIDYQFLDWADEMVVIIPPESQGGMKAIEESVGVQAEIKYAKEHNISVSYFDYNLKLRHWSITN